MTETVTDLVDLYLPYVLGDFMSQAFFPVLLFAPCLFLFLVESVSPVTAKRSHVPMGVAPILFVVHLLFPLVYFSSFLILETFVSARFCDHGADIGD